VNDEVQFIQKIKINTIERIRKVLEQIILTSSIAWLVLYIISSEKLNPYFYFALFSLYFIVGYEIRRTIKLHKSYVRISSLTADKLDAMKRKFKVTNAVIIALNAIIALVFLKLLLYLIPVILALPPYLYYRIDERIVSSKESLIIAIINVIFSIIIFYLNDYLNDLISLSLVGLLDLLVMELGR